MSGGPKVSIVMPAYNCAGTIGAAIRSVQGQRFGSWELLVADDGSKDDTPARVAALAAEDDRIRLLPARENGGPAAARNRAIGVSTGEIIAFLDADDVWEPEKLDAQLALMEETGCGLCYTAYGFIGQNGAPEDGVYHVPPAVDYEGLLRENVVGLSTVALRRQALGAARFDARFAHEDYALWLQLLRGGAAARGIDQPLVHYRRGGRSANKLKAARDRWAVYRQGEGLPVGKALYYLGCYARAALRKYGG